MPSRRPGDPPPPDDAPPTSRRSARQQRLVNGEADRALAFQPTAGGLRRRPASTRGSANSSWPLILHPIIAVVIAIVVLADALFLGGLK